MVPRCGGGSPLDNVCELHIISLYFHASESATGKFATGGDKRYRAKGELEWPAARLNRSGLYAAL